MTSGPHGREPRRWLLVVALVVVAGLTVVFFATERSDEPASAPPLGPTTCGTTTDPPEGATASQVTSNGVVYNVYTFDAGGSLTPTQSVTADYAVGGDGGSESGQPIALAAGTTYQVVPGVGIRDGAAADGGVGGTRAVVVRWPRFCLNISQPTSPQLVGTLLSWAAPAYIPSGQSVASYTVIVRNLADDVAGKVYGRSSSGTETSVDISGASASQCTAANPSGWTCSEGIDLHSGQTYEFRVFANSLDSGPVGQLTEPLAFLVQ